MSSRAPARPAVLAIVGVGPKGLYALESLACELLLRSGSEPAVDLHLFEPHPYPGAGPVYDPSQPHYLRLNFANRNIDLWSRSPRTHAIDFPFERPTFVEWLQRRDPNVAHPDGHAPRALVGEYLHSGYQTLRGWLSSRLFVQHHAARVGSVRWQGGEIPWRITPADGEALAADEVLLATGHDSRCKQHVAAADLLGEEAAGMVSEHDVFPVAQLASVRPQARVAIRGFGLSAIDAMLALTEGRGGRFVAAPDAAAGPRLRYERSGREPREFLPFSRTARAMLPKPVPEHQIGGLVPEPAFADLWANANQRLQEQAELATPSMDALVIDELCEAAEHALELHLARAWPHEPTGARHHAGHLTGRLPCHPCTGGRARARLDELLARRCAPTTLEELQHHVEVAYGQAPPDLDWALAAAWRELYPTLVNLVARGSLAAEAWPGFAALAREMERLAFGPPAENAARTASLARAGLLRLPAAVPGARPEPASTHQGTAPGAVGLAGPVDVFIDAVLAPPGAAPDSSPVLHDLLRSGAMRTLPWNSGIEVDAAGRCIGSNGEPTPGLSLIGRPTEGAVLGNDTLSRTLHDTPERWARRCCRAFSHSGAARPRFSPLPVHQTTAAHDQPFGQEAVA